MGARCMGTGVRCSSIKRRESNLDPKRTLKELDAADMTFCRKLLEFLTGARGTYSMLSFSCCVTISASSGSRNSLASRNA